MRERKQNMEGGKSEKYGVLVVCTGTRQTLIRDHIIPKVPAFPKNFVFSRNVLALMHLHVLFSFVTIMPVRKIQRIFHCIVFVMRVKNHQEKLLAMLCDIFSCSKVLQANLSEQFYFQHEHAQQKKLIILHTYVECVCMSK